MSKRHDDALYIWEIGASNPCGVANALVTAIKECHKEHKDPRQDAAVKLILDQLCFLLKEYQVSSQWTLEQIESYIQCCKENASKNIVSMIEG